jgi:hypothetical protein
MSAPFTSAAGPFPRRLAARVARLVALCLSVAVLWACGPVFIPVPPPGQTSFTLEVVTDSSGLERNFWVASGGPEANAANARYFVFDVERQAGVIARARSDGSYEAPPMEGTAGDRVFIHYEDEVGRKSATACLLLSEKLPTADPCP